MTQKIRLLFVDDEEKFLESTSTRLRLRDLEVYAFTNGPDALKAVETTTIDVALLDLKMPGMDGEQLLAKLKEKFPSMEVVILTGHGSVDSAIRTTQAGAFGYLQKPCELDEVIAAISQAYAKQIMAKKTEKAKRVQAVLDQAIGYSPTQLLDELRKIDRE